ncbi:hypothetical protein IEN85_24245 [Pelagicoccus sp. NFK12]|jgi:hypothetical protein|uniref:Invasion protein n=1 Tax=Pelagicoccus enzymogenes TaxID=2773457 RepID=A0A927FFA6_9BACT|nr:hypothetical protein [Pelagicoccus enzymogenes]MBD5782630.1 hypothetical protein [Pelagicoccus enzymogenes]MDQ8199459.1 hypothetical protein [Pelagicoccus enzymogenes]
MDPRIYSLIHVFSILMLSGSIFYIAANPQKHKKAKMMAINGIVGLVALVGAFGLIAKLGYSYTAGWIIVKLVAWLFLMALAGMAYKKPKGFVLSGLIVASGLALYMVYFKPF